MGIKLREPVNGLTHLIGAMLAVIGSILLIYKSIHPFKPWHFFAYTVFGLGLVLLYSSSALYHLASCSDKGIMRLRRLDHTMIFVLIAATYTPVCLIPLRGPWGWSLFGSIWTLACVGMLIKLFWFQVPRWFSTVIYVGMGWLAIVAVYPLYESLQAGALLWLLAGGLFYTAGALIYAVRKPDFRPDVFGYHELFHVFVILGSVSHFWVMYEYIMLLA